MDYKIICGGISACEKTLNEWAPFYNLKIVSSSLVSNTNTNEPIIYMIVHRISYDRCEYNF